jgi:hypothetical protein
MDVTLPPSGGDEWQARCLESIRRLKQLDREEAALLVQPASCLPKFRQQSAQTAARDLLAQSVGQPTIREESIVSDKVGANEW